ncbi:conserved hypothetical protein [Streptococcus infantis SK1302]|uniref:Uncharacterized protein n=1 Tax=Streptococcus infantis SK1302 TaxID=871237 RepID=A0ABN0B3S9_9STRE|nr:conserved hypothetical protein [Streptococcus infantis SK1302]
MLNLFVSIIVLGMIAFILFWFFKKPQEDGKRAQQKNGYQEIRVEVMGAILQGPLSSKNRNQLALFLIEKIRHLAWTKSFFQTLVCMLICLWETNMWLKSLLKKQVSMVSLVA